MASPLDFAELHFANMCRQCLARGFKSQTLNLIALHSREEAEC